MEFISQLDDKDLAEFKNRLVKSFPFFYYPASELKIERLMLENKPCNHMVVRSITQGTYSVTDFDCAVINGSSENAKSIQNIVKNFMIEKFPDDYPYFYNKNLSKKLDEEKIK